MIIRKKYIFSGRVQGVGFRFTASMNARNFGLTGYVKNLTSGQVEAEFQGEEDNINMAVQGIKNSRYISISSMKIEILTYILDENRFEIK